MSTPRRYIVPLGVIGQGCGITCLRLYFSEGHTSTNLTGLFSNMGSRGMLHRREYRTIDVIFSLLEGFLTEQQDVPERLQSLVIFYQTPCLLDRYESRWVLWI